MSYPQTVLVTLQSISGNSCGSLQGSLDYQANSNAPEYLPNDDPSDFDDADLWRTDLGGGVYSWMLYLQVPTGGSCAGPHLFQRTTAADNPLGDYCITQGGQIQCSLGQAKVEAP